MLAPAWATVSSRIFTPITVALMALPSYAVELQVVVNVRLKDSYQARFVRATIAPKSDSDNTRPCKLEPQEDVARLACPADDKGEGAFEIAIEGDFIRDTTPRVGLKAGTIAWIDQSSTSKTSQMGPRELLVVPQIDDRDPAAWFMAGHFAEVRRLFTPCLPQKKPAGEVEREVVLHVLASFDSLYFSQNQADAQTCLDAAVELMESLPAEERDDPTPGSLPGMMKLLRTQLLFQAGRVEESFSTFKQLRSASWQAFLGSLGLAQPNTRKPAEGPPINDLIDGRFLRLNANISLGGHDIDWALTFANRDKAYTAYAYETLLQRRGLIQDLERLAAVTLQAGNPSGSAVRRWVQVRKLQAAVLFLSPGQVFTDIGTELAQAIVGGLLGQKAQLTPEQEALQNLEKKADDLAQKLLRDVPAAPSPKYSVPLPETVGSQIAASSILLEFVKYRRFRPEDFLLDTIWSQPRYGVFIMRRQSIPVFRDLGEAAEADDEIQALLEMLSDDRIEVSEINSMARRIYQRILSPVEPWLSGVDNVVIAADDRLEQLPFSALVDGTGRYLVQRASVSYVYSGKELIAPRSQMSASAPVILAYPDLNARLPSAQEDEQLRAVESKIFGALSWDSEGIRSTQREARAIATILRDATVYTGRTASFSNLAATRSPSILHIATHGFYLPNPQRKGFREMSMEAVHTQSRVAIEMLGQDIGDRAMAEADDALLRAGLALAGANHQRQSGAGILTGLDLLGIDLRSTRLVVLSACETGLGEQEGTEGVSGLRRALYTAGSKSQVLSLWSIDDPSTALLMDRFYQAYTKSPKASAALRAAQLSMLKHPRYRHPYFWSAFAAWGTSK